MQQQDMAEEHTEEEEKVNDDEEEEAKEEEEHAKNEGEGEKKQKQKQKKKIQRQTGRGQRKQGDQNERKETGKITDKRQETRTPKTGSNSLSRRRGSLPIHKENKTKSFIRNWGWDVLRKRNGDLRSLSSAGTTGS